MIPKAKIVRRRKLPPLKRSKMPSAVPCACEKIWSSTALLIPGVGMCAPMRYTASSASVKRTRFRNSSTRKRFASACRKRFMPALVSTVSPEKLSQNLERAASLGNFILGGGAECVSMNSELVLEIAIAQNLYLLRGTNKSVRAKQIRRDCLSCRKSVQVLQIDDGKRFSKRAAKAALWNATVQRHLTAFKSATARIAAARLLAFVAGAGGSAKLRADTTADAYFAFARAARRAKRFKIERVAAFFVCRFPAGSSV